MPQQNDRYLERRQIYCFKPRSFFKPRSAFLQRLVTQCNLHLISQLDFCLNFKQYFENLVKTNRTINRLSEI